MQIGQDIISLSVQKITMSANLMQRANRTVYQTAPRSETSPQPAKFLSIIHRWTPWHGGPRFSSMPWSAGNFHAPYSQPNVRTFPLARQFCTRCTNTISDKKLFAAAARKVETTTSCDVKALYIKTPNEQNIVTYRDHLHTSQNNPKLKGVIFQQIVGRTLQDRLREDGGKAATFSHENGIAVCTQTFDKHIKHLKP